MMREAIAMDDPVIFLEPKRRYWMKSDVELPVETEPTHQAVVRREGTDVDRVRLRPDGPHGDGGGRGRRRGGLVARGRRPAVAVSPIDTDTIVASVKRTGRAIVVHEAAQPLGMGAEIAARIQEEAFYHLEAPVLRATGFDTPYPPAMLEEFWLPNVDRILDLVEDPA